MVVILLASIVKNRYLYNRKNIISQTIKHQKQWKEKRIFE